MKNSAMSACTGKVAHETFTEAAKASRVMARAHHDANFSAYACKVCHKFHVGEVTAKDASDRARVAARRRKAVAE